MGYPSFMGQYGIFDCLYRVRLKLVLLDVSIVIMVWQMMRHLHSPGMSQVHGLALWNLCFRHCPTTWRGRTLIFDKTHLRAPYSDFVLLPLQRRQTRGHIGTSSRCLWHTNYPLFKRRWKHLTFSKYAHLWSVEIVISQIWAVVVDAARWLLLVNIEVVRALFFIIRGLIAYLVCE